ncbi:MAG TPA: hypothetical protein VGF85_04820 [Opitutaceae bacterium]|jgi:hypothetical protein
MSLLTLPSLGEIKGFMPDRPLGDPTLPSSPVAIGLNGPGQTIDLPDPKNPGDTLGCLVISACDKTTLAVINSSSDKDEAGYFNLGGSAQPVAEDPASAPAAEPPLAFDPTLAYLVVGGLAVNFKAGATFPIGSPATLGLDGSLALDAGACVGFPRGTQASDALSALASGLRTLFSPDDLLSATPNPPATLVVLTFGVQGSLGLCLTLTASSLTATLADSINAVLATTGIFQFTASPSATLTVKVGATDGYRVFAQRLPAATVFSVKKCLSTSLGLTGAAGLTISISSDDLDALVNSAIDQWAGSGEGALARLLASKAGLSPSDQQILAALAGKLKIPPTTTGVLEVVSSKVASFKADLVSRLEALVSAQFTYTWQRLTTQSLVARFTVPDAVLRSYHADILRLDLTRILSAGPAEGITVSRVIGQNTQEIDIGYGFSFGVAAYTFLKSWDALTLKFVETQSTGADQAPRHQYAFLGKRAYDVNWLKTTQENCAELDASTSAPLASPDASDFRTRMSIAFTWKSCKLGDIAAEVVDHGAVLDVFDSGDVKASLQALTVQGLDLAATGDATVSLVVPTAALGPLLGVLTCGDFVAYLAPNALARALYYDEAYPERTDADRRTNLYAQVFSDFLQLDDPAQVTMAQLCAAQFRRTPGLTPGFADAEAGGVFPWTAQTIIADADPESLQDAVKTQLPILFAQLRAPQGDFRSFYPSCVGHFGGLAAQRYGCRVLAAAFVMAASQPPSTLNALVRTVQFSWKDGRGAHALVAKPQS